MTDAELAADLAERAGRLLLKVRAGGRFAGAALGRQGDAAANRLLVDAIDQGAIAAERDI